MKRGSQTAICTSSTNYVSEFQGYSPLPMWCQFPEELGGCPRREETPQAPTPERNMAPSCNGLLVKSGRGLSAVGLGKTRMGSCYECNEPGFCGGQWEGRQTHLIQVGDSTCCPLWRGEKALIVKDARCHVPMAALFTTVKAGTQPRCPSTSGWTERAWCATVGWLGHGKERSLGVCNGRGGPGGYRAG